MQIKPVLPLLFNANSAFTILSVPWGFCQAFCNHFATNNFHQIEFTYSLSDHKNERRISKYSTFSAINQTSIHSDPAGTLDDINFQKWDLSSGSPCIIWDSKLIRHKKLLFWQYVNKICYEMLVDRKRVLVSLSFPMGVKNAIIAKIDHGCKERNHR